MAEHILWTMMSHHSTGAWFSEGIAARGDADQQGVFACVLQTVLLELRSCLRHLAPTHTHGNCTDNCQGIDHVNNLEI